jgi:hypothetical protein
MELPSNVPTNRTEHDFGSEDFPEKSKSVRDVTVDNCKYLYVWKRVRERVRLKRVICNLLTGFGLLNQNVPSHQRLWEVIENSPLKAMQKLRMKKPTLEPTPFLMFHPNSASKTIWNMILTLLLVYTATVMPYRIAFIESEMFDSWFWVGLVVDVLFGIDFVIN